LQPGDDRLALFEGRYERLHILLPLEEVAEFVHRENQVAGVIGGVAASKDARRFRDAGAIRFLRRVNLLQILVVFSPLRKADNQRSSPCVGRRFLSQAIEQITDVVDEVPPTVVGQRR
jgi:hypothetical protein